MLNKRLKILIGIILVVLIFFISTKIINASTKNSSSASNSNAIQFKKNIKLNTTIPKSVYDSKELYIQILLKEDKNPKIKTILANLNLYPKNLVKLASYNKEALNFVYDYPFVHDYYEHAQINIKDSYEKGKIPLFIQWDERWGYDTYGNNSIAVNGCGPTALAMVIVGLTGNTSINPKVIADYSAKNNFYVNGDGTKWTIMTDVPPHFGVTGKEIPLSKSIITKNLQEHNPIILAMGPGVFTKTGHFIVLTGLTPDGKVIVNDPDSKIRSNETWNLDLLMKESRNLWVFKKA